MKKILAITLALIVFVGCTPTDTTPAMEEDTKSNTISNTMVEEDTTPASEEYNSMKEAQAAETALIDADNEYLNKLAAEREITLADCDDLKSETAKADCKEAYGDM